MTLYELMLIKKVLNNEWTGNEKNNARELINREINLKTMDPRLPKDPNMDSEMKMYGE